MHRAAVLLIAMSWVIAPQTGFAQPSPDTVRFAREALSRSGPPAPAIGQATAYERETSGLKSKIGRMFAGGVLGGWVGFFVSHVAVSDWEKGNGRSLSTRGTWALGGMVVGAVAGRLTSPGGDRVTPQLSPTMAAARRVITRDEILSSGVTNAYDLVRSLRSEWLIARGFNSFTESGRGSASDEEELVIEPGADRIIVYLDQTRLGGIDELASIGVETVSRLEFVDGRQAVLRWGAGHTHGVIRVISLDAHAIGLP